MPEKPLSICQVIQLALAAWVILSVPRACAQGGIAVQDSSVGYIDNSIPADVLRFRVDDNLHLNRPSRAEFLYARTGPDGPGLPFADPRVDYQEVEAYLEKAATPWLSVFVQAPWRFIEPEFNSNANGFSDMQFGAKWAMVRQQDQVATFQWRTYVPTGDAHKGLGTNHVSLEPAFLLFQRLADQWALEGELRYWQPAGGTNFAGPVVRYGLGLDYTAWRTERWWLTPVAEFVGWTVLSGKQAIAEFPPAPALVESAAGNTIINAKLGLRFNLNNNLGIYGGYGTALTGTHWYTDTYRLEVRLTF